MLTLTLLHLIRIKLLFQHGVKLYLNTTILFVFFFLLLCLEPLRVLSLGQKDPMEESTQPTPVFLPGESRGQRSLKGYSPWGRKELDTTKAIYRACTSHSGCQ